MPTAVIAVWTPLRLPAVAAKAVPAARIIPKRNNFSAPNAPYNGAQTNKEGREACDLLFSYIIPELLTPALPASAYFILHILFYLY